MVVLPHHGLEAFHREDGNEVNHPPEHLLELAQD